MAFAVKFLSMYLALLLIIISGARSRLLEEEQSMLARHEQWMARHGRIYKDEEEKQKRFEIFNKNVKRIEAFNAEANRGYKLGINQFADLTEDEFRATHTGYVRQMSVRPTPFMYGDVTDIPSSKDWRENGVVTDVKDQGKCGCCWAFSAVAAVEGITKLKTGELISLSEQELVDCDTNSGGCGGGDIKNAFQFIQQHGITEENDYPYTAQDGTCQANTVSPAATITGYESVPTNNEQALLQAVSNQPVSVAIEGSSFDFQHYSNGIFSGNCGTNLNHAVTIVGYGTDNDGTKYWIVKNSWGTNWGENGYMKIKRGLETEGGLCGIAMDASYPTNN